MKTKERMIKSVTVCRPEDNLAEVVERCGRTVAAHFRWWTPRNA
jgi:hypothetical protein